MRIVAIALALVTLPTLLPAVPAQDWDECGTVTHNKPCHEQTVTVTQAGVNNTYYIWIAAAKCAPEFKPDCSGRPNDNRAVNLGVNGFLGIVYQETNTLPGLQRADVHLPDGTHYPPDRMVLL